MSTEEITPSTESTASGDIDIEQASVDKLHKNVLGLPAILFLCVAAIAPAASMLFNVPVMASQAGAATPLVFLLSAVGVLLLGRTVVYFASRLSSADIYTQIMKEERKAQDERLARPSGYTSTPAIRSAILEGHHTCGRGSLRSGQWCATSPWL